MIKKIFVFCAALIIFFSDTALAVNRPREAAYNTWNLDQWNNVVPSPNGYLPLKNILISAGGQDLFFDAPNNEIYLLTQREIIILDANGNLLRNLELTLNGAPYQTQQLSGIFVSRDGVIYITDFEAGEIIMANRNGEIINIFGEPKSEMIVPGTLFRPSKIVVDNFGRMFVQVFGVFEGIYSLTADGEFINFFGANHVEMTLARAVQQIWRRILTIEQRRAMQAFVPVEYSNLFIDDDGFVYATVTTGLTAANPQMLRKLNPLGVNVLPPQTNFLANASFADVTVDAYGVATMIDRQFGFIWQSDQNGRLMFAFGGLGNHLGLFSRPNAIIQVGENLWVLDELKRSVTIFEITEFGRNVHTAMRLHNEGRYLDGVEAWEEVIRQNANYLLAYQGLGRAYFQLEDYQRAMYYFRLAGDREGYSDAFSENSLLFMRANFGWFFLGVLGLTIALLLRTRAKTKRRAALQT